MRTRITFIVILFVCMAAGSCRRSPRRNRSKDRAKDAARTDDSQGVCELEIACKGEKNLPLSLPIRGPKGPPGTPGEPGKPGAPGKPGLPGVAGKDAPLPGKVAFFVGLNDNRGPYKKDINLLFDKIITNVGGAFETETGKFKAPYNGTYQFNVVVAAQGRHRAAVTLVRNGDSIATVWAESVPYWASASNTAILNLKEGDQVWLILQARASAIHGYMYSTFSGNLLFKE